MSFESVTYTVQMYYETQPLSVIAVVACLLLLFYVKPKFMFKSVLGAGCLLLCGMALTSLTGTLDSGVKDRDGAFETARN